LVPYIARPLGQLDPWSLNQKPIKKKLYFNFLERVNLTNSAVLHCTSRTESENVRQIFPEANIQTIPHGVTRPLSVSNAKHKLRERFSLSEDSRVILFLSRWAPKKNIPFLLEVLGGIRQQNWTLILAGSADDGYEKVVDQSVKKHHLADRVICTGHVESEEKQLLLQGSDLFVLPSITENFGIAVAEALCAGLPCIVSQGVDLAPSLLGLAGGWVLPNNLEAWRSHITMALGIEGEKFSGLSERAMLQFSWSSCCERLHNLYDDIIGNSK
jgi:glycosyltransferase involved in cell wall biosynthesis